jgi:glycosyltransferase involved in cell wall biosynthesis
LKILLSAYACEPNTGSEHEIGWSWIKSLSNKNKIYVLTRLKNKKKILKEIKLKKIKNISFLFYDLPNIFIKIIKSGSNKPNSYLYFLLWHILIYFRYKNFIKKKKFDFIHHVTFGTFRIPNLLCLCSPPFIYGPLAGGEIVPFELFKEFTIKSKLIEAVRYISNLYIQFSLLINITFFRSKKIILTSQINKKFIPKFYHKKIQIIPAVFNKKINYKLKKNKKLKICFVGRLVEWKGIEVMKRLLPRIQKFNKNIRLHIYGDGPRNKDLKNFIIKNNFRDKMKIFGHIDQKKLTESFKQYDLLIFPTFRDSGGYVIMEALNNNLNLITTNAPGPKGIIKEYDLGFVNIFDKNLDQISDQFFKKIKRFYSDKYNKVYKYKLNRLLSKKNKVKKIYDF